MTIFFEKWKEKKYECEECDWKGTGAECRYGRLHRKMFLPLNCPSCGEFVDLIIFPDPGTIEKDRAALTDEQKNALETQEEELRLNREKVLQSADQLPEVDSPSFTLLWDQVEGDTCIVNGETIVWSEPVAYEAFDRFEQVALILREKYGNRLKDLAPTPRSLLFLFGDYAPAMDYVKKIRRELFGVVAEFS